MAVSSSLILLDNSPIKYKTRIIQMTKDIWQEMRGSNNKEIS